MLAAGVARAEITPDAGMLNWIDHQPYDGVLDPLFVRALVLSDDGQKVVLLCWDLIDAQDEAVAQVRQAVREGTGVPEAHVIVHASHTHSAPRSPFPVGAEPVERLAAVAADPIYRAWAERLPGLCGAVVKQADAARRPATLSIGRAAAAEWLFNRRPRGPDGAVTTMFVPADPYSLPDGLRFGPIEPTLTVVAVRDTAGQGIASLFHLACHPVAVYPHRRAISADWPGPVAARLASALGGEALFLQGCAGDIVPARRGVKARDEMARFIADRALAAAARAAALPAGRLVTGRALLGLPLAQPPEGTAESSTAAAEIQMVGCGPLAIVVLPGEPLIEVGQAIAARSPFPHTLVLGYANGRGVGYVGLPGEKARGGYEARAGRGAEECGRLLVETAARLLQERRDTTG